MVPSLAPSFGGPEEEVLVTVTRCRCCWVRRRILVAAAAVASGAVAPAATAIVAVGSVESVQRSEEGCEPL